MKQISVAATIIFILALTACKKDKLKCMDEEAFCTLVEEENFADTRAIIGNFLAKLIGNNQDRSMKKLKDWLECKRCVDKAKVICISCTGSMPTRSELRVDFIHNGQMKSMTLNIDEQRNESSIISFTERNVNVPGITALTSLKQVE